MNLQEKIQKSHEVIKQAFVNYDKSAIAIAWTGGKDSTVVLHMTHQLFNKTIPCRVYFNDSGYEFPEVLQFIDRLVDEWDLNLLRHLHSYSDQRRLKRTMDAKLAREAKVRSIARAVNEFEISAFIGGIRHDEHPARSQEKYVVDHGDHTRYHPILHFTEDDIWDYIYEYKVPYVDLYDRGYRSLGEKPFTQKAKNGERSGRDKDKEKVMKRLRSLGYW